jgi:hypothetical protein
MDSGIREGIYLIVRNSSFTYLRKFTNWYRYVTQQINLIEAEHLSGQLWKLLATEHLLTVQNMAWVSAK